MTGHPDFQNNVSCPVPAFVKNLGSFAVGTSWGPITVQMPAGGGYAISVDNVNAGEGCATDITVQHLDTNGNLVWEDFFGAVPNGAFGGVLMNFGGPTLVRGNLYGSTLVISGQIATSAVYNAWINTSGLIATGVNLNLYSVPLVTADPEPKISCGSANIGALAGATPSGLLGTWSAFALPPNTGTALYPLAPYSGPAILHIRCIGLSTTPTNLRVSMYGYTVANGATIVYQKQYTALAEIVGTDYDIDLPACLTVWNITNDDGTQTATVVSNVIAANSA